MYRCLFSLIYINLWFLIAGDFKPLKSEVFTSGTKVTVSEVTKGRGNLATFTLLWAGVPTKPIAFNATEAKVCCPSRPDMNYLRPSVFDCFIFNSL